MRNLLALFGAALLTVVGLGWYLGWYKVASQPASVPGQHRVNIDIDTKKIGTDFQKGEAETASIAREKGRGNQESRRRPDPALALRRRATRQTAARRRCSSSTATRDHPRFSSAAA